MRQTLLTAVVISGLWGLMACRASVDPTDNTETSSILPEGLIVCPEQRPDVCTQQYDPVCGYVAADAPLNDGPLAALEWITDNPEPSNPHRTFGNACSACNQAEVLGYVTGRCEDASAK